LGGQEEAFKGRARKLPEGRGKSRCPSLGGSKRGRWQEERGGGSRFGGRKVSVKKENNFVIGWTLEKKSLRNEKRPLWKVCSARKEEEEREGRLVINEEWERHTKEKRKKNGQKPSGGGKSGALQKRAA